jgi:hypothetical protein
VLSVVSQLSPGRTTASLRAASLLSDVPGIGRHRFFEERTSAFCERYLADRNSLGRSYATDLSAATADTASSSSTSNWLAAIAKLNFDGLSPEGRVDYVLFKYHLEHEIQQLGSDQQSRAEVMPLMPFSETIVQLRKRRAAEWRRSTRPKRQ